MDGEKGVRVGWVWGMEIVEEGRIYIYISLHCHYQNDFCIQIGSDESHFNVSLTVRDKVT